jgi:hypothetical protein
MQLLDDIKEKRIFWNLDEEALDRTLWRTRLGRDCGPIAKQITQRTIPEFVDGRSRKATLCNEY